MPAVSERRKLHICRLNALPQTVAAHFAKGHPAHNKVAKVQIPCFVCSNPILKTPNGVSRSKRHFCSPECRSKGKYSPRTDEVLELYRAGTKIKDIASSLGITPGTVASLLYRRNSKVKFNNRVGAGKAFVKNRLPKQCELCGYSRIVELAHLVPARDGGPYALSNCYSLCPNCHHLMDHGLLTEQEQLKLKEIHASRS